MNFTNLPAQSLQKLATRRYRFHDEYFDIFSLAIINRSKITTITLEFRTKYKEISGQQILRESLCLYGIN